MNNQNRLGEENVFKLLKEFSIPAIIGMVVNTLYNIIDRMYIGRIPNIGSLALTGVGVTFPIIILISAFAVLIGMGGAPLASIKLGENKKEEAEKILGNCFSLLLGISIVLIIFFFLTKNSLLYMFGASNDTFSYANEYLTIYLLGTTFVLLSLGMNTFINSQGFAKVAMCTVLIGAILNIILDPIFIFVFNLGVAGAATATVISQAISCIWVLNFLYKGNAILKIKGKYMKLDKKVVLSVLALGISPFIMQSTESLVQIVFNSGLQKYGGDAYVGAMTIIGSIMQIFYMPLMGIAQGAQPIIGYNFGAKNYDRVKKACKMLILSALTFSIISWCIVTFASKYVVSIFTQDPALTELTVWGMRIFFGGLIILGAQDSSQNAFVALGQAKLSLSLALLRKIVLLIPLAIVLPMILGVKGIFFAEPIADIIATIVTVSAFMWRTKKLFSMKTEENLNI